MMVKTYLLITTIALLQIYYSLSLPEDGNEILLKYGILKQSKHVE
jgi:hypothetical protein